MSKHKKNNLEKAHSQHQLNGKKLQEISLKLKKISRKTLSNNHKQYKISSGNLNQ